MGNQAPGCQEDFIPTEPPCNTISSDGCAALLSTRFLPAVSPSLSATTSSDSTCELPLVAPRPQMAEEPVSPNSSPSTSCENESYQRQADISRRVRKAYDLAKAATTSPAKLNFLSQGDAAVHAILDDMLKHLPRDTLRDLPLRTKLEQICTVQCELERALAHETSIKGKCVDRISRLSQTISCQVIEHEQQLQEALTAKHAAESQLDDLRIKFDAVGREVSRLQEEVKVLKATQSNTTHSEHVQSSADASENDRAMLHTLSTRLEEAMIQAKDVITFKDSVIQSLQERLQLASQRGAGAVELLEDERKQFQCEQAKLLEHIQQLKSSSSEVNTKLSRVESENMTIQQQKAELTVKVAQLTLELETARTQRAQEAQDRENSAELRCANQVANAEKQLEQATAAMQQQMAHFRSELDVKVTRQRVAAQVACKARELKCEQLEHDLQRAKLKLAKQKVKLEKKARALVASAHKQHEAPVAALQRELEDLSQCAETMLQREQDALRRAYKGEEAVERLKGEVQRLKASAAELERERAALRDLCKELETDKKSLTTEHEHRIREMEVSLAKQILAAEARVHKERDGQMQKLMEQHTAKENRLETLLAAAEQENAAAHCTRQQTTPSVSSQASLSVEDESLSSESSQQQSIKELDALIDSKERRYMRLEKRRKAGSSTRSPSSSPPAKTSSSTLKRELLQKEKEVAELSARQKQLLSALATANEQETLAKRQFQETESQRQKEQSRYEDLLQELNTIKEENWNLSLALHVTETTSQQQQRRSPQANPIIGSKSSKGSKGSKGSEILSWKRLSIGRRSGGRVHSNFSLHTRLTNVVVEDRQDAFDPNAVIVKVWEQVLLLCLLIESLLLPYFLSFQPEAIETLSVLFGVVVLCEIVFAMDLYVRGHTGYYSNGNLIRDSKRTLKKYMRSRQFGLDVIAILPTQIFVGWFPHAVVKLLFMKLIRWSRFPHLVSNLDEFYARHFAVLKLLKVLASTVYLAHVLACIRYSFGDDESHSNTWLPESSTHTYSLLKKYLMTMFWSVGIMTGLYEGKLPEHCIEFLFTILVALCGFTMFTTLCATIFVISKCQTDNAEAMEARINQLVHVLSFHRVPEKQQATAVEYLKRYYTDAESTDRETAKLLCPSIANDIQVELLKATIAHISLFGGCSDQFIVALTSLLEMIAVPAQTTLFSAGEYGDAMYVVHSGVLMIVVNYVTVREIRKGSCFGEISVFSSIPRTATVVSATYAILYKLSRFHCERVLEGYPDCASSIAYHVEAILHQLNSVETVVGGKILPSSVVAPIDTQKRALLRNASVAAGAVAGASALVRVLTRKGSDIFSSPRKSLSRRQSKKSVVGPAPQDISQSQSSFKSNTSAQLLRETGRLTPIEDPLSAAGHRASSGRTARRSVPDDQVERSPSYQHDGFWRFVLLRKCIDHHSCRRMWWLLLLLSNLCYGWLMIPVQVFFPLWQQPSWITLMADNISNLGLLLDIFLNLNLSFMANSEKIMDPKQSAQRYLNNGFFFDLLCAFPYEYFSMKRYGVMRLPRLLRVLRLRKLLDEIEQFIYLNGKRHLALLGLLLFMIFHVVACIYFGISYIEGFDPDENEAWICPSSLCLKRVNATHLENCNGTVFDVNLDRVALQEVTAMEYSRSLYFAVTVLAAPGSSLVPTSEVQLIAALILMLSGFLVSAVVVDNVQKRLTASAYEQKLFFEASTRIQRFLRRQKAPLAIHHRVKSFLDYWWSSHRGAVINELLADLPRSIRLDLLRSICKPVLETLALLQGVHSVRDKLAGILVENATFMLYGQGETVYRHGDYAKGLFFLLEGEVCVVQMGDSPTQISRGSFFGVAALMLQERGEGYAEHVSANSGCVLLFVSRDQLQAMETIFPLFKSELLALDQRLLRKRLASMSTDNDQDSSVGNEATSFFFKIAAITKSYFATVYDPDSLFILSWETWVFVAMTVQWALVVFEACFSLDGNCWLADALMVFLECSFVFDMCIRSRLGFYEYGNKSMDLQHIKRQYLRSGAFVLDTVALLPLYVVNWNVEAQQRCGLVNLNKLLRLFKVPRQLHALEGRYIKRTTELRVFKLLYYTFMLSHILGCIWFSFASNKVIPDYSDVKKTSFGEDPWLPPETLENGSGILQYIASLYWSFGLMSSSGSADSPHTTAESMFSVITMTAGYFLFAYVIGNFTDIIELTGSETREFNAKMNAVCQMLDHFQIPRHLRKRVRTFLLFKRFHTITQEHTLVNCLPPPLLTDIRFVYLKPMIEKVAFLTGMERPITRMLVSQFTQVLVSRGEYVIKYGESGRDMFFVFTGILNVLLPLRIANRNKTTFKEATEALTVKKSTDDNGIAIGPRLDDIVTMIGGDKRNDVQNQPKKVNELAAGSYFGENGLFTNAQRNAYIQAQTSCILYRLSRESLELVFDRYPNWKEKVHQLVSIHREQGRLQQLSHEVQSRGMTISTGLVVSRSDIMNERAEVLKERRHHARSNNTHTNLIAVNLVRLFDQNVFKLLMKLMHGVIYGVAVQSNFHLRWLRFIVVCTVYVTILIPYELAMDSMSRVTVIVTIVKLLELLCEIMFAVDVWFSWHVQESSDSMELYDQQLRSVYKKERFVWDVIAAIPFYDLVSLFASIKWFKLLRCIKILNILSYLDELNRRSVANDIKRFWHVWLLYLLMMYWAACAYLAVAMEVGYAVEWDSWLPSEELSISDPHNPSATQLSRLFLRGLFFATTMFVKKGYNPDPDTASLYTFHIVISFIGLIVMSFVIGELASLFISFTGLEVGFRKNHIAVELYMTRLRVSEHIRSRTYAFMTSLWSSHAGVNYEELLEEMPQDIRAACVLHVSKKPLEWFVMKVATPVCWEGDESIDSLTLSLADRLRFESYPRDENVVTEGSIVRAMYFVIKGHLTMRSRSLTHRPLGLRDGSYFGERGLLGCTISVYTVRTARACDLLSLSSEAFAQVLQKHSFTRLALKLCERAYRHLKDQHLTNCSKQDMEEHWGSALLLVLQEIKRCHLIEEQEATKAGKKKGVGIAAKVGVLNAEFTTVSSFLPPEPVAILTNEPPIEASQSSDDGAKRAEGDVSTATEEKELVSNILKELGELPVNMGEMFEALNTSRTCFEAFAPLLHILLATDPLDWKASFWVCIPRGATRSEGQSASVSIESTTKSAPCHPVGPLWTKQAVGQTK
ncbi:unnamed protein product [Phytophthora fragariaefolia]|uniref:Unnamed protein product n=1 Tax=Phytophthora fragariaefolia TaxID=1490495 RepID=A0A9W7CK74_9STRA|nr:unnamed protein product [Phytophthora fragariaefolia]